MAMKNLDVRKNEEYNNSVESFVKDAKARMNDFHKNRICNEYLTREQYMTLNLHSAEETRQFW
jgi:hypothetical protein